MKLHFYLSQNHLFFGDGVQFPNPFLHNRTRILSGLRSRKYRPVQTLKTIFCMKSLPCPPSAYLTCCATLPTWFGGKGVHLRRWRVLGDDFQGFPQSWGKCQEICAQHPASPIITLIISRQTWMTWHSGKAARTVIRTGACGTATLTLLLFLAASPWLHVRIKKMFNFIWIMTVSKIML
jgi:hypothetical protein